MVSLTELHLRAARGRVAALVLPPPIDPRIGTIVLRDGQRESAARAAAMIERTGGCLLADDVGRGKTYVALALARSWSRPLVVAPASLRSTWCEAMDRAAVACTFVSHEALSRGFKEPVAADGVIVDESHRFRSTDTRRYAALATLAMRTRLLLLSATPLQNRLRDLAAQIALFHGARAFHLDAGELARFVVRGCVPNDDDLPRVTPPQWTRPSADDERVLEAILALPSPVAPADGGDAGALRIISLLRAWASSRAALRATLRRRRRIATAIEQSAAAGLVPTHREVRAWFGDEAAIQLGFASLLVQHGAGDMANDVLARVALEHAGLARVERLMSQDGDPDEARARALRDIRRAHPGETLLAFTEFATTARSYYARLRGDAGIGLLTAHDALIASGRLSRDALLARFAPKARRAAEAPSHERVSLLIATDLLSEGVNLQDASVVVHLDLPWNPARLAQRVGRVRRPGGTGIVHSYLVAPPARAALLLDVEARLRRKLAAAAGAIGAGIDVVPRLASLPESTSPADGRATMHGALARRLAAWARVPPHRALAPPIIAAVTSPRPGWLATLDDGRLVAMLDGAAPDDDATVARATEWCDGGPRPVCRLEAERAMIECRRWIDQKATAEGCGRVEIPAPLDDLIERRIARAVSSSARHERAAVAVAAVRLRALLGAPRPIGVEWALEELLHRAVASRDGGWMKKAADLLSGRVYARPVDGRPRVAALIVLGAAREMATAPPSPAAAPAS